MQLTVKQHMMLHAVEKDYAGGATSDELYEKFGGHAMRSANALKEKGLLKHSKKNDTWSTTKAGKNHIG